MSSNGKRKRELEALKSSPGWVRENRHSVRLNPPTSTKKLHKAPPGDRQSIRLNPIVEGISNAKRRKNKQTADGSNKKNTVEKETNEKIDDDNVMEEKGTAKVSELEHETKVSGLDMEGESSIVDKDEERVIGVESSLCLIDEEKVENKETIDHAQFSCLEVLEESAEKIDGSISGCEAMELNVASSKILEVKEAGSIPDGFTKVSQNMVLGQGIKEVLFESNSCSIEKKLGMEIDGLVLGCEPNEEMESDLTLETARVSEGMKWIKRGETDSVVDNVDEVCDFGLLVREKREQVLVKSSLSLKEPLESDGQGLDLQGNLDESVVLKNNKSVNNNETKRIINIPDLNEPYDGNDE